MTKLAQNVGTKEDPYVSGDARTLRVTVLDREGNPFDLSGAVIRWGLGKLGPVGPVGDLLIEKELGEGVSIVDAEGGVFDVLIDPADTEALAGSYVHEAEVVTGPRTMTVLQGKFHILPDLLE